MSCLGIPDRLDNLKTSSWSKRNARLMYAKMVAFVPVPNLNVRSVTQKSRQLLMAEV